MSDQFYKWHASWKIYSSPTNHCMPYTPKQNLKTKIHDPRWSIWSSYKHRFEVAPSFGLVSELLGLSWILCVREDDFVLWSVSFAFKWRLSFPPIGLISGDLLTAVGPPFMEFKPASCFISMSNYCIHLTMKLKIIIPVLPGPSKDCIISCHKDGINTCWKPFTATHRASFFFDKYFFFQSFFSNIVHWLLLIWTLNHIIIKRYLT